MTWDEFKKMVDETLTEAGKNGSITVGILDHEGDLDEYLVVKIDAYYGPGNGDYLIIK